MQYVKIQFGTTFYQLSDLRIKQINELYFESQSRNFKIIFTDGEVIQGITTSEVIQQIITILDAPV